MPGNGVTSTIQVYPKYKKALFKITDEKHLWIICYLHKAKKNVLIAKPKKSQSINKSTKGVFSIHSPDRPNPISLTKVKLINKKETILYVRGLDVIDGTPVLDIKGAT